MLTEDPFMYLIIKIAACCYLLLLQIQSYSTGLLFFLKTDNTTFNMRANKLPNICVVAHAANKVQCIQLCHL